MMTKKKRNLLMIGIPAIIIFITIGVLFILYLTTDLFKSNQTLFFKYFAQNYNNINEITESIKKYEYDENLKDKKYNESSEFKVNYIENYGTTLENNQNPINKIKITTNGEVDKANEYEYKEINLLNDQETSTKIEYLKNNNEYGIRFSDLFKQYVVVENGNLKDLLIKMGYSEEQTQNFPDTIELDNYQDFKLSDDELEKIRDKYLKIVKEKVSNDKISKKTKQMIMINEKQYEANAYEVTLNKEQFNSIYLSLLEKLKEDETILNKIEEIQNYISSYVSDIDLKDYYINNIENAIENINKTNIGVEECTITVYVNYKRTIRTSIKTPEYEIDFDNIINDEEKYSALTFKENDKEVKKITLKQKTNKIELIMKKDLDSTPKIINYEKNYNIKDNNLHSDINIKYEDDSNKLEIFFTKEIEVIDELQELKDFDNTNSIKLNELNSNQISNLLNKLGNGINKEIEKISKYVKLEDIQTIFENIGFAKKEIVLANERNFRCSKK